MRRLTVENMMELAESQVGYMEYPANSNKTKYGASYGANGVAWCVIFQWWLFSQLNASHLFFDNKKTASCSSLYEWALRKGYVLRNSKDARPCDIVLFKFSGKSPVHAGMVKSNEGDAGIVSYEGNTSNDNAGSQSNGGIVAERKREWKDIFAVIRLYDFNTETVFTFRKETPVYDDCKYTSKVVKKLPKDYAVTLYPEVLIGKDNRKYIRTCKGKYISAEDIIIY